MPAADMSRVSFSCGSHCQNIIAATGFPSWYSPGAPFSSATRHPVPNDGNDAMATQPTTNRGICRTHMRWLLFFAGYSSARAKVTHQRKNILGYSRPVAGFQTSLYVS